MIRNAYKSLHLATAARSLRPQRLLPCSMPPVVLRTPFSLAVEHEAIHMQRGGLSRSHFSSAATTTNDERDSVSSTPPEGPLGVPGATLSQSDKMVILYTCRVCETRSARTISKPAYNEGVVLVRCPGCQKLHLIADRLGYFGDESADVESLLAAKGERVRRARIDAPELRLGSPTQPAYPDPVSTTPAAPQQQRSLDIQAAMSANNGDKFVLEFTEEDLRVLRSATKSVNLKDKDQNEVEVKPSTSPTDKA